MANMVIMELSCANLIQVQLQMVHQLKPGKTLPGQVPLVTQLEAVWIQLRFDDISSKPTYELFQWLHIYMLNNVCVWRGKLKWLIPEAFLPKVDKGLTILWFPQWLSCSSNHLRYLTWSYQMLLRSPAVHIFSSKSWQRSSSEATTPFLSYNWIYYASIMYGLKKNVGQAFAQMIYLTKNWTSEILLPSITWPSDQLWLLCHTHLRFTEICTTPQDNSSSTLRSTLTNGVNQVFLQNKDIKG